MTRIAVMLVLFLFQAVHGGSAQERHEATLYKNADCSCCESHADHLRRNGYDVVVEEAADMSRIKQDLKVPQALEGCHSIVVGGYVVEGHVPAPVIDRLLAERPDIRGISLPGMPQGSPGMSGIKSAPLEIFEVSEGAPRVYAIE